MGISKNFPVASQSPVPQGQQVTQTVFTDKGFNAGDYVYSYNNGSIGNNPVLSGITLPGGAIYSVIGGANGGSWGTPSSFTAGNIVGPTLSSVSYTITYPTTTVGSGYLAKTNTINDAYSGYSVSIASLTNGNVVCAYLNTSNNVVFQIYNSSGSLVNSGTVGAGHQAGSYHPDNTPVAVCGLNSGGFVIVYSATSSSQYLTLAKYSASGTLVAGPSSYGTYAYYVSAAADSSDNIYVIGAQQLNAGYAPGIFKFNPSLAYVTSVNTPSGATAYSNQPKIAVTKAGNVAFIYTSGSYYAVYGLLNSSLGTLLNTSYYNGGYSQSPIAVCASPTAGAFYAFGYNNSNIYMNYATEAGSAPYGVTSITNSVVDYTTTIGLCPYFAPTSTGVYDITSNNAVLYYTSSSSTGSAVKYNLIQYNMSGNVAGTASSATTSSSSFRYMYMSGNSGANYLIDKNTTSGYFELQMIGNYVLSGTATTTLPTANQTGYGQGYLFLGVAATTASAGTYGEVIINGQANLDSSYGTSSTPIAFNYNPLNLTGVFGNVGYVVNRVVTLQGLE